jgi:HD superfamily phosphohydrolase
MEVRDPIHGSIHILDEEVPIIQHNFFQRLRSIKQLGFTEFIFPGATHSRFIHSIGVMAVGEKAFNSLFKNRLDNKNFIRLKETFKLACLLHDVGHAPLSHATEFVMPNLWDLQIPKNFLTQKDIKQNRQASHEDYTIKSIADSSFSNSFDAVEKKFGVQRKCIADLIVGRTTEKDYFTIDGINYFPILSQLVSSELDCDRMDYLKRDSYFCGVSYGNYDLDWLIDNLEICNIDNQALLGISERAVVTFDDFLLSRFHMFIMVYFHYRSVCFEQLLVKYFKTTDNEYAIPADIESYLEHDDHRLMKVLRGSKNKYAQQIVQNRIPHKIYESFTDSQAKGLELIREYLESQNIEYIRSSSAGRLSKYYSSTDDNDTKYQIKVARKMYGTDLPVYTNIDEATDLFAKFSESHAVNRLHCEVETLTQIQKDEIKKLAQRIVL